MNILFDIGHPAHVLLFREIIYELRKKHNVIVTAKDKDITYALLAEYGIHFIPMGSPYQSYFKKIIFSFIFILKLIKIMDRYKIDVAISNTSFYAIIASFVTRRKCITLLTVDRDYFSFIFKIFPSIIITSHSYKKFIKKNQIQLSSIFESSYINCQNFCSKSYYDRYSLKKVFVRFVDWHAYDDIGKSSLSENDKLEIVGLIKNINKQVVISVESKDATLKDNLLQCKVSEFHQFLFKNVSFYIGDSGSVASECALLGIPAIYISNKKHGFLEYLEKKYNLVKCYAAADYPKAMNYFERNINSAEFYKETFKMRREFFKDHIDVSKFLVWYIDTFPDSDQIMMDDTNYQYRFKFEIDV